MAAYKALERGRDSRRRKGVREEGSQGVSKGRRDDGGREGTTGLSHSLLTRRKNNTE